MPSSTSNSKDLDCAYARADTMPWSTNWLAVLVVFGGVFVSGELSFRSIGHAPSIGDDLALWILHRERVDRGPTAVALLGDSRMQYGFSPKVADELMPTHQFAQLAISGLKPVATLRDLAEDRSFRGTVICAITAHGLLPSTWEDQQGHVRAFHEARRTWNTWVNNQLGNLVDRSFVVTNSSVGWKRVAQSLVERRQLPRPSPIQSAFDRSGSLDFSTWEPGYREKRIARRRSVLEALTVSRDEWLAGLSEIEQMVTRIQERGGRVAFVRFPTTDEHWELDERYFPRARFWDVFVDRTSATTLHFADVPSLTRFDCPDTSHIDARDVAEFTREVLNELQQRDLFVASD